MAVIRQRFKMFRFPVMYSTLCFPNIVIITIPAASLINYFRLKGAVEFVFITLALTKQYRCKIKFGRYPMSAAFALPHSPAMGILYPPAASR